MMFELLLTSDFDMTVGIGLEVQLINSSNRINSKNGLTNNLITFPTKLDFINF